VHAESLRRNPLFQNAIALYAVQLAGYVVPLVTVPFLARVLRPDGFGLLALAQSFALWLSILLEYGFNLSASRAIASHRDNPIRVAETAAGVLGAKGVLLVVVTVIAAVAAPVVPALRQHPEYLLWAFLQTLAWGFTPFWYFQGTERVVRLAVIEVGARGLATAAIFLVVRTAGDGWKVLALQASAGLVSTITLLIWLYHEVPWRWPGRSHALAALKEGWGMFVFRGAHGLYTTMNVLVLGLFAPTRAVGFYGGAERIARAVLNLLAPLSQTLYPRISHLVTRDPRKAAGMARFALALIGGAGLILGGILALTAPLGVRILLGPGYEASIPLLRGLALLIPLNGASSALAMHWLFPVGMERAVTAVVLAGGLVNVALAVVLAPRFAETGMVAAVVVAEVFILLALTVGAKRRFARTRQPAPDSLAG
jgi:polysaccharide transporter, PST family